MNVEYIATTGFSPFSLKPAANVTACCSAIPTSKNRLGYFLANEFSPLPSDIAGVMAQSSLLILASSIIHSSKICVKVFCCKIFVLDLEIPWNLFGSFSAGKNPFPFLVTMCRN